jgi:hypothetical protein
MPVALPRLALYVHHDVSLLVDCPMRMPPVLACGRGRIYAGARLLGKVLPRNPLFHDRRLKDQLEHLTHPDLDEATTRSVASLIEEMCRFAPDERLSAAQVEDRIVTLQGQEGLSVDLVAWASEHVRPIVAARAHARPEQHPDWNHVSLLDERSQEGEAR